MNRHGSVLLVTIVFLCTYRGTSQEIESGLVNPPSSLPYDPVSILKAFKAFESDPPPPKPDPGNPVTISDFLDISASASFPSPSTSDEFIPLLSEEPAEPSAAPIAAPSSTMRASRDKACFPSGSIVTLASGDEIAIEVLKIGDQVQVSPGEYSPVLLFTHATHDIFSDMVLIQSQTGNIAVSPSHYLQVNGSLKPSAMVHIGDEIFVLKGGRMVLETVQAVTIKYMRGLFNPQTATGTILVRSGSRSQVLASTYTTAVDPALAHAALTPLRCLHLGFGAPIFDLSGLFREIHNQKERAGIKDSFLKQKSMRVTNATRSSHLFETFQSVSFSLGF